jgi:hypothetical protein
VGANLIIGQNGTGTLTIANGGTVNVGGLLTVAANPGSTGA